MNNNWKVKTLDEICNVVRGGSPRPIQDFLTNSPDGVNWIKISDATASKKYIYETKEKIRPEGVSRSRLVKSGDFLLSNSMSFGRPYIMRTSGCVHDGWLVLSDKSGLFEQDYLYHFLSSNNAYDQFDQLAAGSTVRNLNIDLARKVKILLPSIAEQRRIVAILNEAFVGINAAIANAEKNLANARELFESHLNSIANEAWESCELVLLSDLAIDITDGDHMPPPKAAAGIPFITIGDVNKTTRTIDFRDTFTVGREYFDGLKTNRRPKKGDVLYTVTGSFGIPVKVESDFDFAFNDILL